MPGIGKTALNDGRVIFNNSSPKIFPEIIPSGDGNDIISKFKPERAV